MRKKLVKILLVLVIAIFSIQLKAHAAVITSTDKEVQSNSGSVTISVTSKQALGSFKLKLTDTAGLTLENTTKGSSTFELSSDKLTISGSSSDGITSLGSFTFKVPTVTTDTTYKIKFSITGMETTDLETVADETNTAVLKVIAPVVETPEDPEPETPTVTPPAETQKSTEARLKNFGIKPNDFSGFKRDKLEYSTTVPNDVAEVEIYAEKLDDKATVEGAGKVSLKEGNNTFEVKVTAEDGKTTKTYKLTIKRRTAAEESSINGEARLKNLGIKPEEYDFTGFDSEKTEYSAEVPNEVEEIEVYATAMNSSAQITGIGMISLEEGVNELEISVIAADGTRKTYMLEVTRKAADTATGTTDDDEKFGLTSLSITGLSLNEGFKTGKYEYTVNLTEDLNSLDIKAIANDEDATVEIVGNENLKEGENVITIMIENEETEEVATYQIIVNKSLAQEVVQTSWLNPSTWGKEEIIKLVIMIVLVILILIAIWLKIKISEGDVPKKELDLPGAEELDKAIAEHQELSTEEQNYEIEQAVEVPVREEEVRTNYIEEIAKDKNMYDDEVDEIRPIRRRGKHF